MRSEITTRISLSGGDEVKRALQDIGFAGEKALADLSKSSGAAGKDLGAVSAASGDLHAILARLGDSVGAGGFGGGIFATLSSAASGLNTAMGITVGVIAGVVAGFGALAVAGANAASEIKEGAIRVGVSAEDYTKLKFAFEQSGASGEVFEKAMAKILEAANVAAEAAKKNAIEIVKANEAIEASARAASEAARTRAMQSYEQLRTLAVRHNETMRTLREGLTKSLANIDQSEAEARAANAGRDYATDQEIARKFGEQRAALQKENAEKVAEAQRKVREEAAEQQRKQDMEEAEAARKRQQERNAELDKYNKMIEDAANNAGNAFEGMGVKLLNAAGNARDPANVFRDIAEAVGKIADPAERSAKVIELFTRRIGTHMVEALAEGRVGLDELGKEADKLGLTFVELDKNTQKSLLDIGKHFQDTVSKLGNVISANAAKFGLAFAPLFDKVADALAKSLGAAQPAMVKWAQNIAAAITPLFDDLVKVIEGDFEKINSQFIKFIIPIFKFLGDGIALLGKIIADAFTLMMQSSEEIAKLLNEIFGTKITAGDIPAFVLATYAVIKVVGALAVAFKVLTASAAPWLLLIGAVAAAVAVLILPLDQMKATIREAFGETAANAFEAFAKGFRSFVSFLAEGVANIIGTLQGLKEIFINTWQLMVDYLTEKWETLRGIIQGIGDIFTNLYTLIKDGWTAAMDWISEKWNMLFTTVTNGVNSIVDWFNNAWQTIKDGFTGVVDWISDKINALLGFFANLITKAKEVASAVAGAVAGGGSVPSAAAGGMVIAAAMGGLIMGAGTGTSDSIHAMVSNGEYISREASVDFYGPRIYDALNRMAIPKATLMGAIKPAGFSFGGPITSLPSPTVRFAGGGEVEAGGPAGRVAIDLTHNGKTFSSLMAPRMIADALQGHAIEQATQSAGRAPGATTGRR